MERVKPLTDLKIFKNFLIYTNYLVASKSLWAKFSTLCFKQRKNFRWEINRIILTSIELRCNNISYVPLRQHGTSPGVGQTHPKRKVASCHVKLFINRFVKSSPKFRITLHDVSVNKLQWVWQISWHVWRFKIWTFENLTIGTSEIASLF